jgi:hypothetical protein
MNTTLKNVLAVFAGILIGSAVNMSIIMVGGSIVPPPTGVDVTNLESLKAAMPTMEPIQFLMPFLAHALGTLIGGIVASLIAPNQQNRVALIVGVVFLVGGILNVIMLPSPMWFNVVDIVFAYLPFSLLAYKLTPSSKSNNQ